MTNDKNKDSDLADNDEATATFEALDPEKLAANSANKEAEVAEQDSSTDADAADVDSAKHGSRESELPTIVSLGRLEEDLARLQQSWGDVEQQLAAKDSEIAFLSDEREVHMAAFRSLQTDLDEQLDEHDRQLEAIAALEGRIADAEATLSSHDEIVGAKDAEIGQLENAAHEAEKLHAALTADCKQLQQQLKERQEEVNQAVASRGQLEKELGAVKTDMQALEAYIDRRKEEWDQLNARLEDYEATMSGMEAELDKRSRSIEGHDKVVEGLNSDIEELRQRCAELDGRRAERELATRQLNEILSEKSSEIEFLRQERDDACEGSKGMVARIQDQQSRIQSLEHEVAELGCKLKEIRSTADSEVETAQREAREEVTTWVKRAEEAEAEAAHHAQTAEVVEKRLDDLEIELQRRDEGLQLLRDANTLLESRLIDESARVSEISTELGASRKAEAGLKAEYDAFQADMEQRLEANSELIVKLEAELESRNAAIDLLEKNADKLGAINDDIQKLDRQILEGVQSSEKRLSSLTGRNLTLAVDGMPQIKFPIYKSHMTIGRSGESDIQLRRKYISRLHARLTEDDDGVRIEDLGSKNGLFVNAEPVTESYLHDGDIVDIGEVKLRYVEEDQAA